MDYHPLGASGLKTSRLWLGTMTFGDWTPEPEAASIVAATRDAGINAIDTADVYCKGESERLVGRLIAPERERWVLATKLANPGGDGPNERGTSRAWMLRAVDRSLQRLATDWIDLYYLHRDDASTPLEETATTMARLIDQGKVRYWGLSNFRAWRLAQMVELCRRLNIPQPIALQPPYSAVTRGIELELLPACAHYGLGAVTYSPLARGVLSGQYRADAAPPEGSRAARGDTRLLQTEWRAESIALAEGFAEHAASRGLTPTQLAVAWVLRNKLVHGVIGGPRTLVQWQGYLEALTVQANDDDERWVDARVPQGHASTFGYTDPIYPVTGRVTA
jgi:aryl-alcohol dehydrogenase-like predicted oxidoreductase